MPTASIAGAMFAVNDNGYIRCPKMRSGSRLRAAGHGDRATQLLLRGVLVATPVRRVLFD
jgi:hypothetical protein